MKTSNNRKSFIKKHFYLICINAGVIVLFISVILRSEDSIIRLVIGFSVGLIMLNIWPIISCFKGVRALNTINKDDLNKSEQKKTTIAASIMFSVVGLTMLLLWINKDALGTKAMVWIYIIVAIVSGNVFIVFHFAIKKAALKRKRGETVVSH